ncbi:MAG: DNA polymerase III subunit gamma/tau [Planctomycetota bacterium]|nr:MAG: DNA polymerase III subunit gamma/tau [Planctomycetota bacterium]REJ98577.1 MAG: DNA polymerase III subunit gamma/tau [Planctomycetota bacterium]
MAAPSESSEQRNPDEPASGQSGEYVVVARRYRPQTFEELVGQQHVAKALRGAIESNRIGHAYLFTGARGVGKTSAARILSKALQCVDGPTATPCGKCDICQSITGGGDVDVLEIDGASNRGIDEIRQLRQNVNIRPSRARFKIYIIDEVHMLTGPAFNALLKTLEEPPEHVKFIFCTTEPNKIPITVLSRCQRFDFAGIRADSIVDRLTQIVAAEGRTAAPEALAMLARRAAGSMRDSQSLLEQILAAGTDHVGVEDVHTLLGTADTTRLGQLVRQLSHGEAAAVLAGVDEAVGTGVDIGQLLEQLLGCLRDAMVATAGADAEDLLNSTDADDVALVREVASERGLVWIFAALEIIEEALGRLRVSTHRRTIAEVALLRICHLEELDGLADIVADLRAAGAGGPEERAPSASSPAKKKSVSRPQVPREPISSDSPVSRPRPEVPGTSVTAPQATKALSEANVEDVWEQALAALSGSGMVTAKGRQYDSVAISAPNRLEVVFKETYNLCKAYCERPEQVSEIERSLEQITGTKIRVDFVLAADGQPHVEKSAGVVPQSVSRMKQIVEAEDEPLVRQAKELFGARVSRVDENPT